jgi:rSAM/selenodomain-associated transferase 2
LVAQRLSVVVPALNEAPGIRAALEALAPLRARGHEVIVVDGGSSDDTAQLGLGLCDQLLNVSRGRALQMNAGARAATGDALLFLHADTRLPALADEVVLCSLKNHIWGRFDVKIEGRHPLLKVVACAMNLRSRLTGIATGDQAIFVRRAAFAGFPEIALMEDIAFCKSMKRLGPPACRRETVLTSARRWESRGVLRTILLMWRLRLMYFLGARPDDLARLYKQ